MARKEVPERIFVGGDYAVDLCYICAVKLQDGGRMCGSGKSVDVEFQEGGCASIDFKSKKDAKRDFKRLLKAWRAYMEC